MDKKKKKKKPDAAYYERRREFVDIMHHASQAFDKIVVGWSTGAIGFFTGLLTLRRDSVHYHHSCLALIAAILFLVSISFSLYSLWTRQSFSVEAIKRLNKEYVPSMHKEEPRDFRLAVVMEIMQGASGVCFVLGLALMIIFVFLNFLEI